MRMQYIHIRIFEHCTDCSYGQLNGSYVPLQYGLMFIVSYIYTSNNM